MKARGTPWNHAAYMVLAVSRAPRPSKKSHGKRRQPPTLPKTVRLISVPKGKVGRANPKVEEDRESRRQKSNVVSTVVPDDPFETSEDSHDISTLSPMGVEVKLAEEDLDPVSHDGLLRDLEMYSDITGMKVLHVDATSTGRRHQHLNGDLFVVSYNRGFQCNDNDLSDRFEAWGNDKTYDDVLSYHMADCLEEGSNEEWLNEFVSVAFPVPVGDDAQEGQSTMMDDTLGRRR